MWKQFFQHQKGAIFVELAVGLPIVFFILIGVAGFGKAQLERAPVHRAAVSVAQTMNKGLERQAPISSVAAAALKAGEEVLGPAVLSAHARLRIRVFDKRSFGWVEEPLSPTFAGGLPEADAPSAWTFENGNLQSPTPLEHYPIGTRLVVGEVWRKTSMSLVMPSSVVQASVVLAR